MSFFCVSYRELADELINCNQNFDLLNIFIKSNSSVETREEIEIVKNAIQKRFLSVFNKRWQESCRKYERFLQKNESWLKSK